MRRRLWLAAAVFAVDRVTKLLAARLTAPVVLIPGVLGLRYTHNTGAAFSLLSGMPWLLGLLSLAVVGGGWLLLRKESLPPLGMTAAMLIAGGALGNAADRLLSGAVPDMIEVLAFRFAVFNVADICITVGCVLLGLCLLTRKEGADGNPDGESDRKPGGRAGRGSDGSTADSAAQ